MPTFYILFLFFSLYEVESKTILVEVADVVIKPDGKDYDLEKISKKTSCQ